METTINALSANIDKQIAELKKAIIAKVEECGGFVDTRNKDNRNDEMYGIYYNCECSPSEMQEHKISALAVVNGILYVFLGSYCVDYTKEDMLEELKDVDDASNENWYAVDTWGYVLTSATLLNIGEVIEEYL